MVVGRCRGKDTSSASPQVWLRRRRRERHQVRLELALLLLPMELSYTPSQIPKLGMQGDRNLLGVSASTTSASSTSIEPRSPPRPAISLPRLALELILSSIIQHRRQHLVAPPALDGEPERADGVASRRSTQKHPPA